MPDKFSEPIHDAEFLFSEASGGRSRDNVVILAGSGADRVLEPGTILAKIIQALGAATPSADAGNTGDGTVGTVTVGAAKVGAYRLTFIEPATDLGTFQVEDPDGVNVGTGVVGTQFVGGGLTFTVADGSADFVAGDAFTITVAAVTTNAGKFQELDPSAANGAEVAAGIIVNKVTAPDGVDVVAAAVVRDAEVKLHKLVFPSGASQGEKDAAVAQLLALGIVAR